jgi:hypothetical protein
MYRCKNCFYRYLEVFMINDLKYILSSTPHELAKDALGVISIMVIIGVGLYLPNLV